LVLVNPITRNAPINLSEPPKASAATPPDADVAVARRVLALEAKGLAALSAALDDSFSRAVGVLAGAKGRVIVSGIGKSGHVARKIASTMASTGTPAVFVHPAEASHGDLGMITGDDAILCLSNSGETTELKDLIAHSRRFAIPLVAVVGKVGSALEQAADVSLLLPNTAEACPLGLAPTTSTTMMLGLGDALAVALFERKGFTSEQFQVLHPGGRLGKALIRVSDIMHAGERLPLVESGTLMRDALLVMTAKSFGCVGVTIGGQLVGIVTDGDLRRHMDRDLLAQTVDKVMTRNPKTIRPPSLAAQAVAMMNAQNITSLFVVEGKRPVGLLHIHDCLRAGVV
jgi:arabinose-5-phosphate isomerase